MLFIQDDNILTRLGNSSGSSYNLRVEPPGLRGRAPPELFNGAVYGDPETPVLEAQVGDPVVVRTLVAGTNDVHTWHLDGHWFRIEPYSRTSPPVNTVHLGISERFDLVYPEPAVPRAGRATISTTAVASSSCGKAAGACYGSARPAPQALCGPPGAAAHSPQAGSAPGSSPEGVRRRGRLPPAPHAGRS